MRSGTQQTTQILRRYRGAIFLLVGGGEILKNLMDESSIPSRGAFLRRGTYVPSTRVLYQAYWRYIGDCVGVEVL